MQVTLGGQSGKPLPFVCRQGVSVVVKTHTAHNPVVADITLSTEVGMMGAPRLLEHAPQLQSSGACCPRRTCRVCSQ